MSFIFLSHSSQDDEIANAFRNALAADGYEAIFLDHAVADGIVGGELWEERLYTELRRCRALIALVGPAWLASPWCVAEVAYAQALRKPVIPLLIADIDSDLLRKAPPALRRIQMIDWRRRDEARARLQEALLRAGLDPKNLFLWKGNRAPYPGLAAFQREDAAVYFGRRQDITDLLAVLRGCRTPARARLIVVQGASGTGKSSLLRAGVLPILERDPEQWLVIPPFRPLRAPFSSLVDAFAMTTKAPLPAPPLDEPDGSINCAAWARWIVEAASMLRRNVKQLEATVLVTVDQLEEALTGPHSLGGWFLLALREALAAADHRLLVMATLRADSVELLQNYPVLREPAATGEVLATQTFQLGPLPRSSFYAVIEGPASLAGLELQPGLTSRLVDEALTDDSLPLLAFTLRELWDLFGRQNLKLTLDEYAQLGGLEEAVGGRAEEIMRTLQPSDTEREAFRTTLVFGMIELSPDGRILRRPLPLDAIPKEARRLVEAFVDPGRLFVKDAKAVDVVHEALFRRWRQLGIWIEAAQDDLRTRRRLEDAYAAYGAERVDKESRLLPPGRPLEEARALLATRPDMLSEAVREFIERSAARASDARRAEEERLRQESLRLVELAWAELTRGDAVTAILLALEALPNELDRMERPFVEEAAQALYEATLRATERLILGGDEHRVLSAAFSPTGTHIVTGGIDGTARIWSAVKREDPIVLRGHQGPIREVSFSSDGSRVITASADGTARVWATDGLGEPRILRGHSDGLTKVSLSPDGETAVTVGEDRTVRVWPLKGAGDPVVLDGFVATVGSAAFSPKGGQVAVTSWDRAIRFWRSGALSPRLILHAHTKAIWSASYNHDGTLLVTASNDGTARVWSAKPVLLRLLLLCRKIGLDFSIALKGHEDNVKAAVFSPDGRYVVTASEDSTARVWDWREQPEPVLLKGHEGPVWAAAFSPDSQQVVTASADTTARVWNARGTGPHEALRGHSGLVRRASFSPDGRVVLTESADGTARVWLTDGSTGPRFLRGHESDVLCATFDPTGTYVVTASADETARIWKADGLGHPIVLSGHKGTVNSAQFHPRGESILTAGEDGTVRLWATNGSHQTVVCTHEGPVNAACFSQDGSLIATAGADGCMHLLHTFSREELLILRGCGNLVAAVFYANGKNLATVSLESGLTLWSTENGHKEREYVYDALMLVSNGNGGFEAKTARLLCLAISGDHQIVTGSQNGDLQLWPDDGAENPVHISEHKASVNSVAFSPNSQWMLSSSNDGSARFWSRSGSALPITLNGHRGPLTDARFAPDGKRAVTASKDATATIWPIFLPWQELVRTAQATVPRHLTNEQRMRFHLSRSHSR